MYIGSNDCRHLDEKVGSGGDDPLHITTLTRKHQEGGREAHAWLMVWAMANGMGKCMQIHSVCRE